MSTEPEFQETKAAKVASSLPHQDRETVKKTKGLQPRSRAAWSREAMLRPTHENINKVSLMIRRQTFTKTHIPDYLIPEGIVVFWARNYVVEAGRVAGMKDSNNLRDLEMNFWKDATPDMFPDLSFIDGHGNLSDSDGRITNKEYVLMWREKWIHDMEHEDYSKKNAKKHQSLTHGVANNKYFAPNTQPFAADQSVNTAEGHKNFSSSPISRDFLNTHLAAS